jgi:predicted transcriptional regulator
MDRMMAAAPKTSAILLSIRPEFAQMIISGAKRTEFRKVVFARSISHAVIYASSPVKSILGYFEVTGLDIGSPEWLWAAHRSRAGVSREVFDEYYRNCSMGCAIKIGNVSVLQEPLSLEDARCLLTPPQSFAYLAWEAFRRIQIRCQPSQVTRAFSDSCHNTHLDRTRVEMEGE